MKRRDVILSLGSLLPAMTLGRGALAQEVAAPGPPGWRTFEITTRVEIAKPAGRTVVWLPLPWDDRNQSTYQHLLGIRHDAPGAHAAIVTVPGYDARVLRVEWPGARAVAPVTLKARVTTADREGSLQEPATAKGPGPSREELQLYLRPTQWLPTDGMVKDLALRITAGHEGDIGRARAIYDWVVASTRREPSVRGCGLGDVVSLLKSGDFGGKCADINGLFVALARAAGIPARDAYGIRVADSRRGFKSLGKSDDITKAQHCRAEFHAPGHGWVPVDPADVRKVMLEEPPGGLPFEDPKVQQACKALFGGWEMNWIAYNHAHDVALPGTQIDPLPFLMYPQGETADGRLDPLDAAAFRYEIHSRELTG